MVMIFYEGFIVTKVVGSVNKRGHGNKSGGNCN